MTDVTYLVQVLVMPSRDLATVRAIERDSTPCTVARAGDNVAVSLQGIDGSCVIPGGVLCHPEFPVNIASRLELKILVLEIITPILLGSQASRQSNSCFFNIVGYCFNIWVSEKVKCRLNFTYTMPKQWQEW